jgi:Nicotinamide mononucleotide transporter
MEAAFKYFGLDWFGMLTSFAAVYLLGNKSRSGFSVFMLSNLTWIAVGVLTESVAIMFGNVIFFALNLRGYVRWKPEPRSATVPAGA